MKKYSETLKNTGKSFDVDHAEGFPSVWMSAKKQKRRT